jgi:hypothetical protein
MTHSRGAAGAGPDWLPQEINTDVGTVALSDHPVWLPPLRRSNLADHSHDRVVRVLLGGLRVRWASNSLGFVGVFRLNATVPNTTAANASSPGCGDFFPADLWCHVVVGAEL